MVLIKIKVKNFIMTITHTFAILKDYTILLNMIIQALIIVSATWNFFAFNVHVYTQKVGLY